MLIKDEFEDGDTCTVTLKDRNREQDEDEKLWYDRAYGPLQNIMQFKFIFRPSEAVTKMRPGQYAFVVKFEYEMFPELYEEFDIQKENYHKQTEELPLEEFVDENEFLEYSCELDKPYCNYTTKLLFKDLTKEDDEWKEIIDELKPDFKVMTEPTPVSAAKQKEFHEEEEKHNKEKERQAREAQKELEQTKQQRKLDETKKLLKQEENAGYLKIYLQAMNLYFHKGEEDFNVSMSQLSIFHSELYENFWHYSSAMEKFYKKQENAIMPLQGMFHFMKLMGLAHSSSEVKHIFE